MAGDRPPPVSLQRSYSAAGRRSRDRRSPRRRVLAGDMHKDAPPPTAGRDAGGPRATRHSRSPDRALGAGQPATDLNSAVTDDARRHPGGHGVRRDVLPHHRAGSDHRAAADRHAVEHPHAHAQVDVVLDDYLLLQTSLLADEPVAAGEDVLIWDDHHLRCSQHVVADLHTAVAEDDAVVADVGVRPHVDIAVGVLVLEETAEADLGVGADANAGAARVQMHLALHAAAFGQVNALRHAHGHAWPDATAVAQAAEDVAVPLGAQALADLAGYLLQQKWQQLTIVFDQPAERRIRPGQLDDTFAFLAGERCAHQYSSTSQTFRAPAVRPWTK